MDDPYFLYTDGAARGNPGPAAVGAVLYRGPPSSADVVAELSRRIGRTTNNVAEYQAVIEGLQVAMEHRPGFLVLGCDSLLVVCQLRGEWRVKSSNLRSLHQKARRLLDRFPKVKIQHVPREENRRADRLANRALDS